jgi:hypothetical protein
VVASAIQPANLMRRIATCVPPPPRSCQAVPYFSTWSYKGYGFGLKKKVTEHKMCFDFSYNFCVCWNISHSNNNAAWCYHKCTDMGLHVKYRLFWSDFNETGVFCRQFSKKVSNSVKNPSGESRVVPCGSDGQTWRSQQSLFAILRKAPNAVQTSCGPVPLSLSVR